MRDRIGGWLGSIARKIEETRQARWLSGQWGEHPARLAAYILLFVSFLAFLADFLPYKLAQDFAANFATEFFALAITVIVIDRLYERIQDNQLKQQLILQMASRHNDVTDTAFRTLKAKGWAEDGSLRGADLTKANFEGADLRQANLKGVDLTQANLKRADLTGADLEDSILFGANLQEAKMGWANLNGTTLYLANLQEANLKWASLVGADLRESNLQGANLLNANLGSPLDAHKGSVNFDGANLHGAIMPANWVDEQALVETNEAMSPTNKEVE